MFYRVANLPLEKVCIIKNFQVAKNKTKIQLNFAYVLTSISEGFWPNFDKINISSISGHFLHE